MQNKINKMNKKISLEQNNRKSDEIGGFYNDWVLVKELWASIESENFENIYNNIKLETKISHKITIRYFNIVNNSMRIRYRDQIFVIKYIKNVDNKIYQVFVEEIL